MDPGHKEITYLVWKTVREEEKIKGRYSSCFDIFVARPACSKCHSLTSTVPGTLHVLPYLVLAITITILRLREYFQRKGAVVQLKWLRVIIWFPIKTKGGLYAPPLSPQFSKPVLLVWLPRPPLLPLCALCPPPVTNDPGKRRTGQSKTPGTICALLDVQLNPSSVGSVKSILFPTGDFLVT